MTHEDPGAAPRPAGIPARIVTVPAAAGAVDIIRSSPAYEGRGPYAKLIKMPLPRYVTYDRKTFERLGGKPLLHKGHAHRGPGRNIW